MTSNIKTMLLLALLSGIIIVLGGLIGGRTGIIVALLMAVAMNVGSYWFSDQIVLRMYNAREASPDEYPWLNETIAELARNARIPMPRVYVVPEQAPNAFATGRDPEHAVVAVTEGILPLLSPEELRGVLAHEIGHVVNRDILVQTVAGVMASAIVALANMMQFTAFFGGNRDNGGPGIIGSIVMALLAPLAASLIRMAISRSREYLADETGARLCGQPLQLAGALEKLAMGSRATPLSRGNPSTAEMFIVTPLFNLDGGIARLFSTHPPIEERIARLRSLAAQ